MLTQKEMPLHGLAGVRYGKTASKYEVQCKRQLQTHGYLPAFCDAPALHRAMLWPWKAQTYLLE